MIDQDLIQKNKERLLAELKRRKDLLARVANPHEEFGDMEDENASEVSVFEANLAAEKDLEGTLAKVEAALSRIENGAYGICQVGGEEIDRFRLEAAHEADTCIEHAQK